MIYNFDMMKRLYDDCCYDIDDVRNMCGGLYSRFRVTPSTTSSPPRVNLNVNVNSKNNIRHIMKMMGERESQGREIYRHVVIPAASLLRLFFVRDSSKIKSGGATSHTTPRSGIVQGEELNPPFQVLLFLDSFLFSTATLLAGWLTGW